MNSEPPTEPEPYKLIEIEPQKLVSLHRHTTSLERATGAEAHLVDHGAIPERPAHVCPNCDYNLTGLSSRRCPECGEEFSLLEARMRAIELSDGVRRVIRAESIERAKLFAGIGLMLAAVWLQNVGPGTVSSVLGIVITYRGWVMIVFMAPLWCGLAVFKSLADRTWAEAIWAGGLVAICISAILWVL
jgi:hypothetical protein